MAGWGDFFGKIAQQFQSRTERLKNEKVALIREKLKLLQGECTREKGYRMLVIDNRLDVINELLHNKAQD